LTKKRHGHYLGTEIDGNGGVDLKRWLFSTWIRRVLDLENSFIYFHRHLTVTPILIASDEVSEVKIGKWHSRSWAGGKPVVKILWEKDNS